MNTLDTILARVVHEDRGFTSPCWIWTGAIVTKYGQVSWMGKGRRVHRVVYEEMVEPIPVGLQLDHLCRVTTCCNPNHLEPVTCKINLLRGDTFQAANAAKTHCIKGHLFDAVNSRGARTCRTCQQERDRTYRRKNLEKCQEAERLRKRLSYVPAVVIEEEPS